ncbi:band 7 protein AGAP004871 isoform X3 [Eurytemora carolleeae]|uniref:band 7 protein AGAP004871 isoform X3 n=1 Tax=Eurytemora carolleeae TaxID=1294199 RepID=UPI000C777C98|nr:band 7 protein AGAP004871 isoform X3 [Eurytemora carolleeae]|eukprot:XP_023346809.1 band 7 protein AGAP004871-like isoform X3 [Eurytemora affinis]
MEEVEERKEEEDEEEEKIHESGKSKDGKCRKQIQEMCADIKNKLEYSEGGEVGSPGLCALLLSLVSLLLVLATMPLSLYMCIKVVQEYERAVIFRLGRLVRGGAKGPGIFFILPCIDTYKKVDLRTVSFDVPPQEILSRDSVTVTVDAVVYYRVSNPTMATNNVEDYGHSTHLLGATTLRKDVRLPVILQRAMAAEAEAAREARAKVIAAEGEQKASRALRDASTTIAESPAALQLRYLQTLSSISGEKNSTIIFPVPIDILNLFRNKRKDKKTI